MEATGMGRSPSNTTAAPDTTASLDAAQQQEQDILDYFMVRYFGEQENIPKTEAKTVKELYVAASEYMGIELNRFYLEHNNVVLRYLEDGEKLTINFVKENVRGVDPAISLKLLQVSTPKHRDPDEDKTNKEFEDSNKQAFDNKKADLGACDKVGTDGEASENDNSNSETWYEVRPDGGDSGNEDPDKKTSNEDTGKVLPDPEEWVILSP